MIIFELSDIICSSYLLLLVCIHRLFYAHIIPCGRRRRQSL